MKRRILLTSSSIVFVLFLMGLMFVVGWVSSYQSWSGSQTQASNINPTTQPVIDADRLMLKVNEWRVANKYLAYEPDNRVCNLAKIRAYEVDKNFSHDGFSAHTKDFYHQGISENISDRYNNESEVVNAWINSPTHLDNLKKNYRYSCIACVTDTCAQIFANF